MSWYQLNKKVKVKDEGSFCVMPWVHFHVTQNGNVAPCCQAPWDKAASLGNINEASIPEIWNGEPMRKLRKTMLAGKIDSRCQRCFDKEKDNWLSLRKISNEKYRDNLNVESITDRAGNVSHQPIYLDIRFSNVCNFKCRICGPWASSQWHQDAISVGMKDSSDPAISTSIIDQKMFWLDIDSIIPELQQIYFAGGEPLVMKEHYVLLDKLIEKGKTDIELSYNTNFSKLQFKDYDIVEYWRQFKRVNIAASIDAMEDRGEYLRKNMVWSEILENRKVIKDHLSSVEFMISPTVYIMNVIHLIDFHKTAVEQKLINVEDFIPTMLVEPAAYNIQVLPSNLKSQISSLYSEHVDWIQSMEAHNQEKKRHCIEQFRNIPTYMNSKDQSKLIPEFIQRTKELDELRNESFTEVFPELKAIFK